MRNLQTMVWSGLEQLETQNGTIKIKGFGPRCMLSKSEEASGPEILDLQWGLNNAEWKKLKHNIQTLIGSELTYKLRDPHGMIIELYSWLDYPVLLKFRCVRVWKIILFFWKYIKQTLLYLDSVCSLRYSGNMWYFCPIQEFFSHIEPLLKGCKCWPILGTHSHWTVRVLKRTIPTVKWTIRL